MQRRQARPKSKWSRLYRRRLRDRLIFVASATLALVIFRATAAILLLALKLDTLTVAAGPRDGADAKIL